MATRVVVAGLLATVGAADRPARHRSQGAGA